MSPNYSCHKQFSSNWSNCDKFREIWDNFCLLHFSRAHSYILCRRRSLCSFTELQLPSTPASYIITENRKEKRKKRKFAAFQNCIAVARLLHCQWGKLSMCKKDFQVPGCSPSFLGLGKITQASVKLYPSKYSYKSRLYLTVERPGCHK